MSTPLIGLLALVGCGLMLALTAFAPRDWIAASLCITACFSGSMSPMTFTVGQTLAGPTAAGRWMGIQNLVGNLAGISAPMVTGWIVQTTGSFRPAFLAAACLLVLGLICWGLVLGPVGPVYWRRRASRPLSPMLEAT